MSHVWLGLGNKSTLVELKERMLNVYLLSQTALSLQPKPSDVGVS